ncbi:MAG: HAMP domain-containing sensor histidine kinase [Eubacteriales bacterium]|nr:HAMP domain-containing sensor histidine kinase [Eubacteriales bacterium]
MVKGITGRWVLNTLCVIVAIILFAVVALSFIVSTYFYSSVEQNLSGRSVELSNILSEFNSDSDVAFSSAARDYVENFPEKEQMEITVINSSGLILVNSTGFTQDTSISMPDYDAAKTSSASYAKWVGRLPSGEKVTAVTRMVKNSEGDTVCAIRYVTSMSEIDKVVIGAIIVFSLVGLLIIAFVVFSGTYFIRSIVRPVQNITDTAKKIAQGDFNAQIDKMYDDEIGDLSDSINDMARALGAADRMKNDFISSVSHELRTPLTAIKGWAETMQGSDVPDKETFDKGMGIIVKESARLTGIVEELLDFSRMQNNQMMLMKEKLDVIAELDEVIYMMRDRAQNEGKHLLYDQPEIVAPVMADRNKLKQVFINIIDNALKYTPQEGVIGIQLVLSDELIKVVVTDTGCGIAPDDLPRVKDKFFKANQSVRGSGIGLAIADEIMALHGGTLDIESGIGVGTTVTLTLPLAE